MRFDLTISNPPYNNGADLGIHKSFSEVSKRIVFVHPSTFLVSHKLESFGRKYTRLDLDGIESAHLFWANALFNIQLSVPVVVSRWNANKIGKSNKTVHVIDDAYTHCEYDAPADKIHYYGKDYPMLLDWYNRSIIPIIERNGSIGSHAAFKVEGEFGYRLSTIRGHPPLDDTKGMKDDFYTILPKSEKSVEASKCGTGTFDPHHERMFSFRTEAERENFLTFLKTKAVRFVLSMFKFSIMLMKTELTPIPWMDFTKEWHDEDLRKLWFIDDDLWRIIDQRIPDYYKDYRYN